MSPTKVAYEEDVVADPDDAAAIKTVGAAYEAWVGDIGYDLQRLTWLVGRLGEER